MIIEQTMKMTINTIHLKEPYITKKIDSDTLRLILDSTHQTAYRIYLLTNEIKAVQPFVECYEADYWVRATVKTTAAFTGEARRQAWAIRHLQPLLHKRPRYKVSCSVTHKMTNKEVYRCELETINKTSIYKQIQDCISELNDIIYEKNH